MTAGEPDATGIGSPDGLAEAIAAGAEPLARAWPRELLAADPDAEPVSTPRAVEFVGAVAAALGDDLAPLSALCGLDDAGDGAAAILTRLDTALRHLEALRRVSGRWSAVSPSASDDPAAAFSVVARHLAIQAAATLAARTDAAEEHVREGTASMAVAMHELRRPLSVLSSYAQLLAAGALGDLAERGRKAADAMVAATEVMVRLVEALGAFARLGDPIEPAALRDLELAEVVSGAVDDVLTEAQLRDVAIDRVSTPGLRLRGDRERLRLAITNLLSNAVKHSDDGGRVEVRTFAADGAAHVVVRDHGPGFPPETAARLFEKYYRDDRERERGIPGLGLGLFIVNAVAERHGGRALARVADGGGAEFELIIPGQIEAEDRTTTFLS